MNIRPETFIHALDNDEVYVSTNTACSSGDLSASVMTVYNDRGRALHTIRISLSSITTTDEVNKFLELFDKNYVMRYEKVIIYLLHFYHLKTVLLYPSRN